MLRRYPRQLSGGQRQRVGLMRALMLDPPILLLDEPLGALDPIVRVELQEQLGRLVADLKKTVVMVTHDVREAARLGHTITLLHAGGAGRGRPAWGAAGLPAGATAAAAAPDGAIRVGSKSFTESYILAEIAAQV